MWQVSKKTLNLRGKILFTDSPLVMGILNITPDSFFSGSRTPAAHSGALTDRARHLIEGGADILDIGGYSTRPGASPISPEEELARVIPAIVAVKARFPDILISVDTFRSKVAEASVGAGAHLINDVSGGNLDPGMFETVAKLKVPYILTHMRGTPATMSGMTVYENFPGDILSELREKLVRLRKLGVADVIVDPGFGFAKTADQNFGILAELNVFRKLGCAVLIGVSRKSAITKTLNNTPEESLNGTTVLHTLALAQGAYILRAHDATEARQAIILTEKIRSAKL